MNRSRPETSVTDFAAPLPRTGVHLIEASAGTGKTWTLSTLVVRAVTEQQIPISAMLLVTFTNDAANELRHRVRSRLYDALRGLESDDDRADDPLIAHLRGDHAADHVSRLRTISLLRTAIRDFDQATITTIHSFAQQLLRRAGLAHDPSFSLIADYSTVATDLIIDRLAEAALGNLLATGGLTNDMLPTPQQIVRGLQAARSRPGVRIRPDADDLKQRLSDFRDVLDALDAGDRDTAKQIWGTKTVPKETTVRNRIAAVEKEAAKARHVTAAVTEVAEALRERGELCFDDLLTEAATLIESSTALVEELQRRHRFVLVDEFQDTDRVQWAMLQRAFTTPLGEWAGPETPMPPAMILVGDPKQAIYRFRGGDLATYGRARSSADSTATLTTNFRSQEQLVAACNHLFSDAGFGSGATYEPVAAYRGPEPTIGAALSFRVLPIADAGVEETRRGIASDLAQQVSEMVAADPQLSYRDVVVLYNAHSHAPPIKWELERRGIPAVIAKGDTVLNSAALRYWRLLLSAMERPSDARRARAAALTPILGRTVAQVTNDDEVSQLQHDFVEFEHALSNRGVAFVAQRLLRRWRVAERLAASAEGERRLVDFEHLGELLHLASDGRGIAPSAALELLDELVLADPAIDETDMAADIMKRRLDTEIDQDVVRLMSVHASKGLEFPVVLAPTLWAASIAQSPLLYHDDSGPVLEYLARGDTQREKAVKPLARVERVEEARRLAYVALTRASRQTIVWWPDDDPEATKISDAGLAQILSDRSARTSTPPEAPVATLRALAAAEPGLVSVTTVEPGSVPVSSGAPAAGSAESDVALRQLGIASVTTSPDRSRGRLSFTSISKVAFPWDDDFTVDNPDPDVDDDEGSTDENPDEVLDQAHESEFADDTDDRDDYGADAPALVRLATLPAGREAGTRLHALFEHLDFASPASERRHHIAEFTADWLPADTPDLETINRGLDDVVTASLGPMLAGLRLADVTHADRLDEMQFDLPMRSDAHGAATLPALSDVLLTHLRSATAVDHHIRSWAQDLGDPARVVRLGGFLTGSIDLLWRYERTAEHGGQQPCYVVTDYKSNKIARWPEPLTDAVFAPERLVQEMIHGQYLLQALLYLVATHRFLAVRLNDYSPDTHLGPAAYLFVRGMTGAIDSEGQPHGVFLWRPPTACIEAVDSLLFEPLP